MHLVRRSRAGLVQAGALRRAPFLRWEREAEREGGAGGPRGLGR